MKRAMALAAVVFATVAAFAAPAVGWPVPPDRTSIGQGGLTGAGNAVVESVIVPARMTRVAAVPDSANQFWGFGHVNAYRTGWSKSDEGQVVFAKSADDSWTVKRPPIGTDGKPMQVADLTGLVMDRTGAGWAIGHDHVLLRKDKDSDDWVDVGVCKENAPAALCGDFDAIAMTPDGSTGYIVGPGGLVLHLENGEWKPDAQIPNDGSPPQLVGVAVKDDGTEAWAIASSPSSSNEFGIELYRRQGDAWAEFDNTGREELENPQPTINGTEVRFTVKGKAAAFVPDRSGAFGDAFWFSGSMFPFDPSNPTGDAGAGETSERPYTLAFSFKTNSWTSYCAPIYTTSSDQTPETPICAEELPISAFPIMSLSRAGTAGHVFAGGFGLLHFNPAGGPRGQWFREPDPVGKLSSVAFTTPQEGWLASVGDAAFGSTVVASDSIAMGHYTCPVGGCVAKPPTLDRNVARWATPPTAGIAYGVAVSPDGKAPPVAVGELGIVQRLTPEGWVLTDFAPIESLPTLVAVAYAGTSGAAWAVGSSGAVAKIENGIPVAGEQLTTGPNRRDALWGVAFRDANSGFAVGENGAIMFFNGKTGQWQPDPIDGRGALTSETLFAVDTLGAVGYVAVGSGGTVLVNRTGAPGGWDHAVNQPSGLTAKQAVTNDTGPATFYAVDGLADGSYVAGGTESALLTGTATLFRIADAPPEGTILALRARKEGGTLKMVASIAPPGASKWNGPRAGTNQGWLLSYDGAKWKDLQKSYKSRLSANIDHPISRDPILALVDEPGGRSGWGVGGRPIQTRGGKGDGSFNVAIGTASIWRYDLDDDAGSPDEAPKTIVPSTFPGSEDAYSFAFFSDAHCGYSFCSLVAGTGTAADETLLRIRDDINKAAKEPSGPKFVLFGGSARGSGTPEETKQFAEYLRGFDIPVFGAPGSHDLTPLVSSASQVELPAIPTNIGLPVDFGSQTRRTGSNVYYGQAFAGMPTPWGSARREDRIRPVPDVIDRVPTKAATHYAFDYLDTDGNAIGRFIFIDTSNRTLNANGQNPLEEQGAWLNNTLLEARTSQIPTFAIMNMPTRDPDTARLEPILPPNDVTTIENALITGGATAVFAGGVGANKTYSIPANVPGAVPFYISAAAGSPQRGSGFAIDGNYHAWLLGSVDPSQVSLTETQAGLTVDAVPVLDSLSVSPAPENDLVVSGGGGVAFDAWARAIDGGGADEEDTAANHTYLKFPYKARCETLTPASSHESCTHQRALLASYRFTTDDPSIARFVKPEGDNRKSPLFLAGKMLPDLTSGFMCTFRTGRVMVTIEAGGRSARIPVTVVPGIGPCVSSAVLEPEIIPFQESISIPDDPPPHRPADPKPAQPKVAKPAPPVQPAPPPTPAPQPPEPTPVVKPVPKVFLAPQPLPEITAAIIIPAPSLLPSPAPPASASAAGAEKQDEKEVEHEGAGQEGGDFVAISHRREAPLDASAGWLLMGTAALLGVFGAGVAATKRAGNRTPSPVTVSYPRDLR